VLNQEKYIMDDIKRAHFLAAWLDRFLNTLPCACAICARPATSLLCAECRLNLTRNDECCEQCAEELPLALGSTSVLHSKRCGRCISNPPAFQRTFFAYDYNVSVAELIQRFKFGEMLILSKLLADMISQRIKKCEYSRPDALIPVPLHPVRLKQRGFNQSLELARAVGKALNIPVYHTLLIRTRNTPKQSGLDRKTRENNIKGAFRLQTNEDMIDLAGKHLAIIDDVITTGSTAQEVAKVLKCSGVDTISVIAIAKTRNRIDYG
jgi:ComF family protein